MQTGGVASWTSDQGDRWGWRAPVVLLFILIAVIATSTAVTLGWSRATLISTDGYVASLVEPLASDPDVKDAVATELAREMTANMGGNIAAQLTQWVPAEATAVRASLETFAAQIEEGWRNGLKPAIRAQLDQPSFHALWVEANREAHRQLIDALRDGTTGATVTLDLHDIAQSAVRETGVQLDQQLNLPGNIGTTVYAALAESLPPEAGRITVDVSRISREARSAIGAVDPLFVASLGAAAFFALVAVGIAPRRRRGTALALVGVGAVLVAGALWVSINAQAKTAGSKAAAVAVTPMSAEMQLVVDREAKLGVDSFRTWAFGTAVGGGALVVAGVVWRLASGRGGRDEVEATSYASSWDDAPAQTRWSSSQW